MIIVPFVWIHLQLFARRSWLLNILPKPCAAIAVLVTKFILSYVSQCTPDLAGVMRPPICKSTATFYSISWVKGSVCFVLKFALPPFSPLSPLESKFQNNTCTEPLTQSFAPVVVNWQLTCNMTWAQLSCITKAPPSLEAAALAGELPFASRGRHCLRPGSSGRNKWALERFSLCECRDKEGGEEPLQSLFVSINI